MYLQAFLGLSPNGVPQWLGLSLTNSICHMFLFPLCHGSHAMYQHLSACDVSLFWFADKIVSRATFANEQRDRMGEGEIIVM